jgi:predicted transcriptional regulator
MTTNQMILFLMIYNGNVNEEYSGTIGSDTIKLNQLGLVEYNDKNKEIEITNKGSLVIQAFKNIGNLIS